MLNGMVTFNLPGLANYKVTIAHGNYKCRPLRANQENIAPSFFLEAENI
jgi:hypothetical protein